MTFQVAWWFEPLIDFLWDIRVQIQSSSDWQFAPPDYSGLSSDISSQLTPTVVNIIQNQAVSWLKFARTKNAFSQSVIDSLSNKTIVITQ